MPKEMTEEEKQREELKKNLRDPTFVNWNLFQKLDKMTEYLWGIFEQNKIIINLLEEIPKRGEPTPKKESEGTFH